MLALSALVGYTLPMGLPERLAEALQELGKEEEPTPEPEASVDPYARWKAAVDQHRKNAISLESRNEGLRTTGTKLLSDLEAVARTTHRAPPEIDQLIDSLLQTELERKRDLSESSDQPDPVFTLPQLTQADRLLGATVKARYENALRDGLGILRDMRWDLMALRAEYEDPGDAPVFDNPADLLRYLQAVTSDGTDQD
jgi:hypothetical protein